MIGARTRSGPGLAERLEAKAARLAAAHAEAMLRARRADPGRWRKARLLWPLSTGDR